MHSRIAHRIPACLLHTSCPHSGSMTCHAPSESVTPPARPVLKASATADMVLKGIDPILSGDLLKILDDMGHGDQLL